MSLTAGTSELVNIQDASVWASKHLDRQVTASNIQYLVQYGRIRKYSENGNTLIALQELEEYYRSNYRKREGHWKNQLGEDLNWALSFENYRESETTKHVHRLHPYKGKFIPQLVEYFLDSHIDNFKQDAFFKPGSIVLDPFCGSGTTLVQANELGLHAVGVDISAFNVMISGSKIQEYSIDDLHQEISRISRVLKHFVAQTQVADFEEELLAELNRFNSKFFPVPEYKYQIRNGSIEEKSYSLEREMEFLPVFNSLVTKHKIQLIDDNPNNFIKKWFFKQVRSEMELVLREIQTIHDQSVKKLIAIILSRTIRSCRATTHADLATLLEPVRSTYYCKKHGKICKPIFSIMKWWNTYSQDTIKRIEQFRHLRTNSRQVCITGDSRNIDILESVRSIDPELASLISGKGIDGIFTSPPYVGLIDYHEQHAYAYDLFGFDRRDDLEIGPLYRGQGKEAQLSYIEGISAVLVNCKKYLVDDYNVFLVANDKYRLYPTIADRSGMKIVNQYKRPVLNRTEKDKRAYSETIFHLKRGD